MSELTFGRVTAGPDRPVVIIAEAACEHLGSFEVALRLVDAAKAAGADIVKFQHHLAEEMIPGSIQFWAGSMDDVLAKLNLKLDEHVRLLRYCEEAGIQYLCTPFSAKAARELRSIGVSGFKTGSGEMTNIPMQREIAKMGLPMIVSTGMATIDEIDETVAALREEGASFALMNCTSAYPPRYEDINLNFIPKMRERYGVLVGHSDHTPDAWTTFAAVAVGARILEKHFTLDRSLRGPDHHVSLEPPAFAEMVRGVRSIEAALGSEKHVHDGEREVRDWAHHSIVTVAPIRKGATLTRETIGVKRPGRGIPAKHLGELVGRRAARDLAADVLLRWEDVDGGR